jgi:pimeloyl-ACP methyl ester carboxylesterase
MSDLTDTGVLDGHAVIRLGSGRPLLYLPGLSSTHVVPTGSGRTFELREAQRYATSREVWWVQRRMNLQPGATMADIAGHYATFIARHLNGTVDVVGASTGGSVGLQLAADHPAVVRRLAVVSAACRLGPVGRSTQRRVAELARQGRRRRAAAALMAPIGWRAPARVVMRAFGWVVGGQLMAGDLGDMIATIEAEDRFDLTSRLASVVVPTLVVGGARDRFYGAGLFQETAEGLADGALLMHPGKGHAGTLTSPRTAEAVLRHLDG